MIRCLAARPVHNKKSRRHPNSAISVLEIPTRLWLSDFIVCWLAPSSACRETGSRREGFIRLLLKGRFSTLRPVSPPAQPGPAPCPLSPHICKSLKLSGLDHRDRAGLCQTSDSLPGLDLNGLDSVREHRGERRVHCPRPAAPVPLVHQSTGLHSASDWGTALHPTEGVFFESTGE